MGERAAAGSPIEDFLADFDRISPALRELPRGFRCDGVFTSDVAGGVELLYLTGHAAPRADELRRAWKERSARRAVAVLAVAAYPSDDGLRADLVGLHDERLLSTGVALAQVERAATAALEAGSRLEAERLLAPLFEREDETGLPRGLRNEGLFAAWELTEHVPARDDWASARARAQGLKGRRNIDLLAALGWRSTPLGSTGHLIGDGAQDRAVAVLLQDDELFDRRTRRFDGVSPVERGLSLAHSRGVRWVVAVQGDLVRLYSASADVGVGRKGASSTYTELHLAALDDERLAYAPLLLSPEALAPGGSVEQILDSSADHATSLGARLRDRVYEDAVPHLAETVADRLGARTEPELAQAYHVTLVILFRLLFVAYAEDRALLPYKSNTVYTRVALKARARQYTEQQREHGKVSHSDVAFDVWHDLTDIWRAVDEGHSEWGVPAYSGGLFSDDDERGRAIAGLRLTNAEIGPALVAMLVDTGRDGTFGPVDFQALSVREFGTIYEGLLESSLSLAPVALTLDERNSYVPAGPRDTIEVREGRVYFHNASGARKATGSYFTKQFAVEHLLTTALDPAVDDHLARIEALLAGGDAAGAGEAFFDLRVADIAMGSGHFLIGAVDHIALRMSAFLAEHPVADVDAELGRLRETAVQRLGDVGVVELPEIDPANLLRRQVARRCIYGVDINQIAVDLARLALWIHTFVPGLPMSSLEHGLVQGNALTGIGTLDEAREALSATPAAPGRRATATMAGQIAFGEDEILAALTVSRDLLVQVRRTAEATAAEVDEAAAAYRTALAAATPAKELLDAAVASRLGLVNLAAAAIDGPTAVRSAARAVDVRERMEELDVLHFPVAFPEVFLRERPGFDVILGNPPWEKVKVEEHSWWAARFPGLGSLAQGARDAAIRDHRRARPDLVTEYEHDVHSAEQLREALRTSRNDLGSGDTDLFRAFSWRGWDLLAAGARCAVVLPRSAVAGSGTAVWRRRLLLEGTFEDVCLLTNTRRWVFGEVHPQYSVVLLTVRRRRGEEVRFSGPFHSLTEFADGHGTRVTVSAQEFSRWTTSLTFPLLPGVASTSAFHRLRRSPRFDAAQRFSLRPVTETHATADKALLDFSAVGAAGRVPVLSGASFNLWDPDFGPPYASTDRRVIEDHLFRKRMRQVRTSSSAFFRLAADDPTTLPFHRARIAFRDVTRATDQRTVIAALLPPGVTMTHKAPYLLRRTGTATDEAYLLAVMSSIAFDWYARRFVEISLSYDLLNAMPVPRSTPEQPAHRRVVEISARLAAVDDRYEDWAAEVGVPVGSVTDPLEKAELIAELDALVSLLYGLERDDVEHVFATFHRGWAYQQRLTAVLAHYDRWADA